jgi:hypothetical protein
LSSYYGYSVSHALAMKMHPFSAPRPLSLGE